MTEDRGRTIGSRLLRRHSSLTDLGPGLRKKSSRPPGALLRRTSSFGGGPIVVVPVQSLPPETEPPHLRWLILLLACLLLFGNYYAYDNPAALNRPLQAFLGHDYDTWQYELNLMYAVYSFPNMFIPLIGGSLMDKADPAWVLLGFSTVVCLGQSLFALGVTLKSFSLMLLGRILFGIGGESISVAQASITTSWFKGKELAFALGLNLCIARLGSVANSIMSPRIERKFSVPVAVWVGTLTCCMSLCCALVLSGIIRTRMKLRNAREEESRGNNSEDEVEEPQTRSLLHPLRKETSAADLDEANMETQPLIDNTYQVDTSERDTSPTSSTSEISGSWADFTLLPLSFWIVCLICVLLYGTVVPFNNIASDFLMSKWYPGDTQTAGAVMRYVQVMNFLIQ